MGKNAFNLAKDARYDPKYGINGRVKKDEFSIDGKSWNYRDPQNKDSNDYAIAARIGDDGSAEDNWSKDAKLFANPLYDYSYGQVRDAAKELDIGNVNDKSEVKQILDRIQNGPTPTKEKKEDNPKKFLDNYIDKTIKNESTKAEVEIPTAQNNGIAKGDNSINSPITQANPQTVTGDNNVVSQNNAIKQGIDNRIDNSDNSTRMFLDDYKLNLGSKLNLRSFS
jgi:hypothetical protein